MSLSDLLLKVKRKLLFNDNNLFRLTFRDDNVKDIPNVWRLAEAMKTENIKYIRRCPKTNRLILKTPQGTYLATNSYFWVLSEIFCWSLYNIDNKYFDSSSFIVFDFGMNRAYASLFFAQHPNCKKIFGYEPDPETYKFAEYNIALNPHLAQKIEPFNFGLGRENKEMTLFKIFNRDGVNSLNPKLNATIASKNRRKMQTEKVLIKNTSDEVSSVLSRSRGEGKKIILKIDVEGAEYEIFDDLCTSGVIEVFDLIVGDVHNGLHLIMEQLSHTHNLVHRTNTNKIIGFIFEKKGSWS
ncbi:MAG: FkbM family methyltransferase [Dysgonamonadaceae bacterium]|jgi:FkbM family methyltransferase|nr:FkbM family methyltransferase [Dysgonamonadaceae bacterium]